MAYPTFDRSRLRVLPLGERKHDMAEAEILRLDDPGEPCAAPALTDVAARIRQARADGAPVIILMGAHVIKTGLSRFLIDLMERGIVTHIGMNGAGAIHDFELSLIGATTESVARYIQQGQFGLWQETGRLNDIARTAAAEGIGFGEALGREIAGGDYPHKEISVFAAGYRLGVPVTIHVSLGQDIIHEHPNCDGAALGAATYTDFLVFAEAVTRLQGGVFLNYGTAVMGPEVYLKALSMARNVAHQENRRINRFSTAVFDLVSLGDDLQHEAPKTDARYYYRPFKTILVRTVQDGGESFYIQASHRASLPALHRMLIAK